MADSDEMGDGLALMDEAGDVLRLLNPTDSLLRYCDNELLNEGRKVEFINTYWPKEKGDWQNKPGSLVLTYCVVRHFIALRRRIASIVIPEIDPIEYLYKGKPMMGSSLWITCWQMGASGLTGGTEGEEYGQEKNRDLALRFLLRLDPRMIVASGGEDCAMSPLVQSVIDKVMVGWSTQWSWAPQGDDKSTGESIVTVTNLLDCAMGKDRHAGYNAFGIASHDKEKSRWLMDGLDQGEPVMAMHLHRQISEAISLDALKAQIERAPKT